MTAIKIKQYLSHGGSLCSFHCIKTKKRAIMALNDHFARRGLGEFLDQRLFSREEVSLSRLKPIGLQSRLHHPSSGVRRNCCGNGMRSKRWAFKTKETLSWLVLVFCCCFFFLGELKHSNILGNNENYLKYLRNWLKPVAQSKSSRWKRCWRASLDGWAVSTFHSRCGNKGPTVTIIRVGGKYIFGGYTSLSWGKWFSFSKTGYISMQNCRRKYLE